MRWSPAIHPSVRRAWLEPSVNARTGRAVKREAGHPWPPVPSRTERRNRPAISDKQDDREDGRGRDPLEAIAWTQELPRSQVPAADLEGVRPKDARLDVLVGRIAACEFCGLGKSRILLYVDRLVIERKVERLIIRGLVDAVDAQGLAGQRDDLGPTPKWNVEVAPAAVAALDLVIEHHRSSACVPRGDVDSVLVCAHARRKDRGSLIGARDQGFRGGGLAVDSFACGRRAAAACQPSCSSQEKQRRQKAQADPRPHYLHSRVVRGGSRPSPRGAKRRSQGRTVGV